MRWRSVFPVLGAVLLAGCVTSETFEAKQAELAACRAELTECEGKATTDRAVCAAVRERLEAERTQLLGDITACRAARQTTSTYAEEVKSRAAHLRERLKAEIEARDVEIEELRDQLSVRVLDRILFNSGSADILPAGRLVLDKLAHVLRDTDDYIRIEGHTDFVPIGQRLKEKYFSNWELSAGRATSVVRYFEHGHDIAPTRMEAVGFSKFRPVAAGESPQALQRNRRVEIVLTAPRNAR